MTPPNGERSTPFAVAPFPRTRYQGSKRKFAKAILDCLADLDFTTVLDAFGGTGCVSHAFKCAGKQVTYNDILSFNHKIGLALIENDHVRINKEDVSSIGHQRPGVAYGDFIERTFEGIYFTREENQWLDVAVANVQEMPCRFGQSIAWFAIFQAAMAKRPYNLFHRRNLYMRTADVQRSFGNKASWDRPFLEHVIAFAAEANEAVIDGGGTCRAVCRDALEIDPCFDLVYIDTPYINRNGVGVAYRDFYHFLEGMVAYEEWPALIDQQSKHLRLRRTPDPWSNADACEAMFQKLFDHHRRSHLAVSYRNDGIPSVTRLVELMRGVKKRVQWFEIDRNQYALSTRRDTAEVLILGTD